MKRRTLLPPLIPNIRDRSVRQPRVRFPATELYSYSVFLRNRRGAQTPFSPALRGTGEGILTTPPPRQVTLQAPMSSSTAHPDTAMHSTLANFFLNLTSLTYKGVEERKLVFITEQVVRRRRSKLRRVLTPLRHPCRAAKADRRCQRGKGGYGNR